MLTRKNCSCFRFMESMRLYRLDNNKISKQVFTVKSKSTKLGQKCISTGKMLLCIKKEKGKFRKVLTEVPILIQSVLLFKKKKKENILIIKANNLNLHYHPHSS